MSSASRTTQEYKTPESNKSVSFSHLHQLFNAETCQSYIHTLRWKERPLQCPRCQSHNVGPWGTYHYQPGLRRYRCKEKACKRTFNDLTGTRLDGSSAPSPTGFSPPFCYASPVRRGAL